MARRKRRNRNRNRDYVDVVKESVEVKNSDGTDDETKADSVETEAVVEEVVDTASDSNTDDVSVEADTVSEDVESDEVKSESDESETVEEASDTVVETEKSEHTDIVDVDDEIDDTDVDTSDAEVVESDDDSVSEDDSVDVVSEDAAVDVVVSESEEFASEDISEDVKDEVVVDTTVVESKEHFVPNFENIPKIEDTPEKDDAVFVVEDVDNKDEVKIEPAAATESVSTDTVSVDESVKVSERKWSTKILAIASVAALAIGGGIGFAVAQSSGGNSQPLGKVTVTEAEIDTPVAYYKWNGQVVPVTAREVVETNSTVEKAKKDDGSIQIPTADSILAYIRNQIIKADADKHGVNVDDAALSEFAKSTLGTDDFAAIADAYGMDEEGAKAVVRESARAQKLREEVLGEQEENKAPELPEEPEIKNADSMTEAELTKAREDANAKSQKQYADYIKKLVGPEWDEKGNAWADKDSVYAQALSSFDMSNDGASYDAALTAYYVAYQNWSAAQNSSEMDWSNYVNELFENSSVNILSLAI